MQTSRAIKSDALHAAIVTDTMLGGKPTIVQGDTNCDVPNGHVSHMAV